jgi:mannose-6-phosphate isomerase-like protein (cupin superfamily)
VVEFEAAPIASSRGMRLMPIAGSRAVDRNEEMQLSGRPYMLLVPESRHRIRLMQTKTVIAWMVLCVPFSLPAQERRVDPTWLHRYVPGIAESASDFSTRTCRYKPIFGDGDPASGLLRGISRFGELAIDPRGASAEANYPAEEQVYVVLEGTAVLRYGEEKVAVRTNDYMYLPPGILRAIENPSDKACRVIVMGFRIPAGSVITPPPSLLRANIDDVKREVVGGHPPTTLYQLLMGDTQSKRDKLAAGHVLTSLFIMEFAPEGTNFPHHHDREEEIYLILHGDGEIVAGGGTDGIEGRYPAKPGDAYFFRLNCTVGFYAGNKAGEDKARILAVRSLYPFGGR